MKEKKEIKMTECYFIPKKGISSATICDNVPQLNAVGDLEHEIIN